eukprot:1075061-Pleurochrysis_carterae.AAC.4
MKQTPRNALNPVFPASFSNVARPVLSHFWHSLTSAEHVKRNLPRRNGYEAANDTRPWHRLTFRRPFDEMRLLEVHWPSQQHAGCTKKLADDERIWALSDAVSQTYISAKAASEAVAAMTR